MLEDFSQNSTLGSSGCSGCPCDLQMSNDGALVHFIIHLQSNFTFDLS